MQGINLVCHSVITHWYFIIALSLPKIIKALISEEDVKFVYTVKLNQNLVEATFWQQRARGQTTITFLWSSLWRIHKLWWYRSHWQSAEAASYTSRKRTAPDLSLLCHPLPKHENVKIMHGLIPVKQNILISYDFINCTFFWLFFHKQL